MKFISIDSSGNVVGVSDLHTEEPHIKDNPLIIKDDGTYKEGDKWDFTTKQWVDDDTIPVVVIRGLNQDEFRQRFDLFTRIKLDKLEAKLEDDEIFDSICVNSTDANREDLRDFMRTAIKELYTVPSVHIDDRRVKDALDLFMQAGVIDQETKDIVLDVSTL